MHKNNLAKITAAAYADGIVWHKKEARAIADTSAKMEA